MTQINQNFENDFPSLGQGEQRSIYLDSAATSLTLESVAARVAQYYLSNSGPVHRGAYKKSEEATAAFEGTREAVARFLGASSPQEILFTPGTTLAINQVALMLSRVALKPGDEILITQMEHHANIVPWQMAAEWTGAKLRYVPLLEKGVLDESAFRALLSKRTKILAMTHVSNVLGTINPVREWTALAKAQGAFVLIDGAQAAPHLQIDVKDIGCDFYVFSPHKVFGPTGFGVLYMNEALGLSLPPVFGGGHMIERVTMEKSTYAPSRHRYEPGTPAIASVIGFAAALDYIHEIGWTWLEEREQKLLSYLHESLKKVPGLKIYGPPLGKRVPVISFTLACAHPHDIASILDSHRISVRAGHHCCQPLMSFYNTPAMTRASLAFYNTFEDVDALHSALMKVVEIFS